MRSQLGGLSLHILAHMTPFHLLRQWAQITHPLESQTKHRSESSRKRPLVCFPRGASFGERGEDEWGVRTNTMMGS